MNRSSLIAENFCCSLSRDYEQFLKTEDLTGILEDYNAHLVSRDKEVRVLDPKEEFTGISRGHERRR